MPIPAFFTPFLTMLNDGPQLVDSDYWNHDYAQFGLCVASWNAGAVRLLVPRRLEYTVTEMASAREVLLTIGQWGRDPRGLELMWEDHSAAPFSFQLCSQQVFPFFVPPSREASCHVYIRGFRGRPLLAGEWSARVRCADRLPYLRSWGM